LKAGSWEVSSDAREPNSGWAPSLAKLVAGLEAPKTPTQGAKVDLPTDFDRYPRQVILFYNGAEHREFKRLVGELAEKFGTKNQSDTVLCSLKALMTVPKRFRVKAPRELHNGV
jgi:hypothetical protein